MMTLETALADTSYDMELEKLKKKIASLYQDLLLKHFKVSNPGAPQDQIDAFMEANELEFKEAEDFNEEADGLEKLLELLSQEEDLDKVKDKEFEKADVETTKELKSKSNESTKAPKTSSLPDPKGGLFTPSDKRSKTNTKTLSTPRGKIERLVDDEPKVSTQSLKDIWDAEREKLLELVRKRNKEHGVKFW